MLGPRRSEFQTKKAGPASRRGHTYPPHLVGRINSEQRARLASQIQILLFTVPPGEARRRLCELWEEINR